MSALFSCNELLPFFFQFLYSLISIVHCQNVSSEYNMLYFWFKLGLVMYLDATTCVSFYGLEVAHQKRYQISTHLNGFFEMIRV